MIQLGDTVEDTITGFRGIAVARYNYIESPNNISVQPVVDQFGNLPDSEIFVEGLLKVIKARRKPEKIGVVRNLKGVKDEGDNFNTGL